ncbi:PI-actitoxin-Avd5a-like [Periplaneta americana]|uniref:PI-actitoxin-Avd5a-like n=1 Tax=Periplaneta americana TaxID=6978 RepID=UPI0037E79B69
MKYAALLVAVTLVCVSQINATVDDCTIDCTRQMDPVCGTDGVTYDNKCLLEAENECHDKNIRVDYEGECSQIVTTGRLSSNPLEL